MSLAKYYSAIIHISPLLINNLVFARFNTNRFVFAVSNYGLKTDKKQSANIYLERKNISRNKSPEDVSLIPLISVKIVIYNFFQSVIRNFYHFL